MIYYATACIIVVAIMATLGFGGIAGALSGIARALVYIFVCTLAVSLLADRRQRVRG